MCNCVYEEQGVVVVCLWTSIQCMYNQVVLQYQADACYAQISNKIKSIIIVWKDFIMQND